MSLINDVLLDLEKRGVDVPVGEGAVRVVAPREQRNFLLPLVLVGGIVVGAALAYKFLLRVDVPAAQPIAQAVPAVAVPAPAPVSASAVVADKVLLQVPSTEEAVAKPKAKPSPLGRAGAEQAMPSAQVPVKVVSPQQRAESEFYKANLAVQEGRLNDALAGYESALLLDPYHKEARRSWVGVLLNLKRNDEAERVLQRGLKRDSHDTSFAMLLARLQVERDALPQALETLQKTLPYAEGQADYQSFVAALLQRQGSHKEAIERYRKALKLAPGNGVWLMGMGISMQALQHNDEARDAYQRALASHSLNPQLQTFVQNKLKEL